MPIAYPVTRAVAQRVLKRVAEERGIEVMLLGQGSVVEGVVIYLAAERDVDKSFRDELRALVREEMADPDLTVYVVVVQSAMDGWSSEEERPDGK